MTPFEALQIRYRKLRDKITKEEEDNYNKLFERIDYLALENEKLKEQLKESNYTINSLIHHFHRYGMDEESLVILMEVEKAKKYLTKYKVKE